MLASRPVMPWTTMVVFWSVKMPMRHLRVPHRLVASCNRKGRRIVDREFSPTEGNAIVVQQLPTLILTRTGKAEYDDRLARVFPRFSDPHDDSSCHQICPRVAYDVHDHGQFFHVGLADQELRQLFDFPYRWVSSNLSIVGRSSPAVSHGIEDGQTGTTSTDQDPQDPWTFHHPAGNAPIIEFIVHACPQLELSQAPAALRSAGQLRNVV